MINIFQVVYDTLATIGYPVREQGTNQDDEALPDSFVDYFLADSPNNSFADNKPTSTTYRILVTIRSRDPEIVQGADALLKEAMVPAGFMRASGRSLPQNPETGHYAWSSYYRYYEMED